MFGRKKTKDFVGLDIGSHSIKALELKPAKEENRFEVKGIGYELLPHDAIVEGTIIDATAVSEAIRLIYSESRLSNKNIIISISGSSVIIKKIALHDMETEELAESIIWEAKHNIPYPYEETNVDYAILKAPGSEDNKNMDILLVAAKKDKIANYSNAVSQAKHHLVAIDTDVFALQNAFEYNYPDIFPEKTAALINIGANITNIVIVQRGIPQLFRDLNQGGALFSENIRKELNIDYAEAERLLKGIPIEGVDTDRFTHILETNIQNFQRETEKTLSFFAAGDVLDKGIDIVFISGGLATIDGFAQKIEEKFQVKTEVLNPFRRISYDENKFDSVYFTDMAAHFGVAAGLALRTGENQS